MYVQKKGPMQHFSYGQNDQRHGSRARAPSDEERPADDDVAQHGGHPNVKMSKKCQMFVYSGHALS